MGTLFEMQYKVVGVRFGRFYMRDSLQEGSDYSGFRKDIQGLSQRGRKSHDFKLNTVSLWDSTRWLRRGILTSIPNYEELVL